MKKIEKLEIPDTNAVIGLADRDGKEIEIKAIGRKINEIIDILNSRLFEPIITVHNQSQKQPEGDYVNTEPEKVIVDPIGVDFTTEGKNREFPVEYKTREEIDKMFKPEKQEEWREKSKEEFYKQFGDISVIKNEISGNQYNGFWNWIENKISQLLSERTFNKEELKVIEEWYDGMLYPTNPDERDKLVHDKLSKLLKEEE